MNRHHKQMLRQRAKENPLKAAKPIKRRPKRPTTEVITIESSDSDDDLEDVDLSGAPNPLAVDPPTSGDSDAFEDLEDVDLDAAFGESIPSAPETLTFAIQPNETIEEKKGKKFDSIGKEERWTRKLVHKLYIEAMVAHGMLRNRWCNDQYVCDTLRTLLPSQTVKLLNESRIAGKESVQARRFILGLLKAQELYSKKFKVTCQGLVRKDWGDMLTEQNFIERNVNLSKFRSLTTGLQGSRDIGAQGFVSLLRSCGVHCRLIFSLQPPDFRSVLPAISTIEKKEKEKEEQEKKPRSEFDPVFIPNAKHELLEGVRKQSGALEQQRRKYKFPMSRNPIFWVEAWNKFSKKWITIDPVVFNCVEVMPMRKKNKFEPPGTDKTHQFQYILAFDSFGRVKDVTRRYSVTYNANVIKKRIDSVSDEDEHWYRMVLRAASTPTKRFKEAEIYELKEFYDRDVSEGIPKSKKAFKNHPIYALESEIRQDEVIYPKDNSSRCGTFKSVNKSTIEPIYKRSHVHRIRTAKAWHMRGRVLKMGVLPLKTKKSNTPIAGGEEDDIDEARLYAEFQTQLLIPPPIVDGKITKNAFGNVEIFTSTMIPENGYLVKLNNKTSMKLLERAARDILRIDYAKAIVAFDFGKKGTTTPKEGGILIDEQFKEAIHLVIEGLIDLDEEEKRKAVELNALKCWKFFLAKLRIMRRLDREHGKITNEALPKDDMENESNDEEGYFSVASEGEGSSEEDKYVPRKRRKFEDSDNDETMSMTNLNDGGFIPNSEDGGFIPNSEDGGFIPNSEDGGFIPNDDEGGFIPNDDEGGFIPNDDEGGFIPNDDDGGFIPNGEDGGLNPNSQDGGYLGNGHFNNESGESLADGGILIDTQNDVRSHEPEAYSYAKKSETGSNQSFTSNDKSRIIEAIDYNAKDVKAVDDYSDVDDSGGFLIENSNENIEDISVDSAEKGVLPDDFPKKAYVPKSNSDPDPKDTEPIDYAKVNFSIDTGTAMEVAEKPIIDVADAKLSNRKSHVSSQAPECVKNDRNSEIFDDINLHAGREGSEIIEMRHIRTNDSYFEEQQESESRSSPDGRDVKPTRTKNEGAKHSLELPYITRLQTNQEISEKSGSVEGDADYEVDSVGSMILQEDQEMFDFDYSDSE